MIAPRSRRQRALVAIAALLLAACASKEAAPPAQPEPPPPVKQQEVTPQRRSELHTELAAGYYERGQMDIALDELKEAVALEPNNAKAYNIYGLVYTVLGENTKAEQSFARALSLAPKDAEIRQNWGWYLCTHERMAESIPEFEAAVRDPLYKTPEIPLINAGRCSVMMGDAKGAEAFYQRALKVAPNNGAASYGLALLAYGQGRYEEARGWLRTSRQPNPPAQTLYLGMCVEKKLGDQQAEASFMAQLKNRFPDSAEAKAIGPKACE
jgi:type IV pilus assembly protein PilF